MTDVVFILLTLAFFAAAAALVAACDRIIGADAVTEEHPQQETPEETKAA
ncbi:MAG: hypothetical protein JWL83_4563 [Actinomycetia bacterium]|jgi:hypothetical protein|nr:hypothetical protein [Actinomycetes bacterium]